MRIRNVIAGVLAAGFAMAQGPGPVTQPGQLKAPDPQTDPSDLIFRQENVFVMAPVIVGLAGKLPAALPAPSPTTNCTSTVAPTNGPLTWPVRTPSATACSTSARIIAANGSLPVRGASGGKPRVSATAAG